jgi:hypothetical protein
MPSPDDDKRTDADRGNGQKGRTAAQLRSSARYITPARRPRLERLLPLGPARSMSGRAERE